MLAPRAVALFCLTGADRGEEMMNRCGQTVGSV